jgi:hypothetical protein
MTEENLSSTPTTAPTTITVTEPERPSEVTLKRSHIVLLCSIGLIITFFLPWLRILWVTKSGFELAKVDNSMMFLWIMPVTAGFAAISGLTGKGYQFCGIIAGLTPICILAYGLSELGKDLFDGIVFGGWLALVCGIILIIAAAKK